jgi:protein transport protein SEC23
VDYRNKIWMCPFCLSRNAFPSSYHAIHEGNIPQELHPGFTTMSYALQRSAVPAPVYLFILDLCVAEEEELAALKKSVLASVGSLPGEALVGLVTYGRMVQVHELGFGELPRSYVFRGSKAYGSSKEIGEMLGLSGNTAGRFLVPVSEAAFTLQQVVMDLGRDAWPVAADQRAERATGAALGLATSVLELLAGGRAARLLLLTSGPCTIGPGQVVGVALKEPLRTHHDLEKDGGAKHYKRARAYYDSLRDRLAGSGRAWGLDMFVASYDQTGLFEMQGMVGATGGVLVLADAYQSALFQNALAHYMASIRDGTLALHGTLEILASRELRVCGAIGPVTSLHKKGTAIAEASIGIGGTTAWKLNALTPDTTLAVYLDLSGSVTGTRAFVQFLTTYQRGTALYVRVTTLARAFSPELPLLKTSFDQEVAAVIMARLAVHKAEQAVQDNTLTAQDVLRWLDRTLIRLCQKMGEYRRDEPGSFALPPTFSIYPQFMFHLRRSPFLSLFNASPDETAFIRHTLLRQPTADALTMIQPTLTVFSLGQSPQPALLDVRSLQPDVVLLLDTFFHIVIYQGVTVAAWLKQQLHLQPSYSHLQSDLIDAPRQEALQLMQYRFPMPRYVETCHGESQGRFLLSKLNPSTASSSSNASSMAPPTFSSNDPFLQHTQPQSSTASTTTTIFTDDVSLQVFIDYLKKVAVSSSATN